MTSLSASITGLGSWATPYAVGCEYEDIQIDCISSAGADAMMNDFVLAQDTPFSNLSVEEAGLRFRDKHCGHCITVMVLIIARPGSGKRASASSGGQQT